MEVDKECRNCIIKRAETLLDKKDLNTDRKLSILSEITIAIDTQLDEQTSWVDNKLSPAQLGTIRQEILWQNKIKDMYAEERKIGKQIGNTIFDRYQGTDLVDCLIISTVGNGIEFDVGGAIKEINYNFLEELEVALEEPNLVSKAEKTAVRLKELLSSDKSSRVLFILDNLGEHLCDAVLMEKLLDENHRIAALVNEYKVLNDVTVEDMREFPLEIEVISNGRSDVGTFLSRISSSARQAISSADLIIIKGMANFETLSREILGTPSLYLLKIKCDPVARIFDKKEGEYVMQFVPANRSLLQFYDGK